MIPKQTRRGLSAAFASWGEDLISGRKENVPKLSPQATTSLHDSLCSCTAENRSSLKQGLAFCPLEFLPPQYLFPLTSPTSTFHNLKNKPKPKVLDLCFSGASVPHLTCQSLSSQKAAEILWAKPLLNWELFPAAAACSFACAFLVSNPLTPQHTCSHPLNPTPTLAIETDTEKGASCHPSCVSSRHDPAIFTASSSHDYEQLG